MTRLTREARTRRSFDAVLASYIRELAAGGDAAGAGRAAEVNGPGAHRGEPLTGGRFENVHPDYQSIEESVAA